MRKKIVFLGFLFCFLLVFVPFTKAETISVDVPVEEGEVYSWKITEYDEIEYEDFLDDVNTLMEHNEDSNMDDESSSIIQEFLFNNIDWGNQTGERRNLEVVDTKDGINISAIYVDVYDEKDKLLQENIDNIYYKSSGGDLGMVFLFKLIGNLLGGCPFMLDDVTEYSVYLNKTDVPGKLFDDESNSIGINMSEFSPTIEYKTNNTYNDDGILETYTVSNEDGDIIFELESTNTLEYEEETPFYKSLWFYVLLLGLAGGLVAFIIVRKKQGKPIFEGFGEKRRKKV